nr:hypothetical protein CFP56_05691 [Quercus suber]
MVVLENWIRFDVSFGHENSQINPTINKSSCVSIDGKASPAPLPSIPICCKVVVRRISSPMAPSCLLKAVVASMVAPVGLQEDC